MPDDTMTAAEYRAMDERTLTEDDIHKDVITWARANEATLPALRLLFHVPNGGARDARTGARMKELGTRKGVPDLILPQPMRCPERAYHGLALELKSPSGRIRSTQAWWLLVLRDRGYAADVAWTFEEAVRILRAYCEGTYTPDDLHLPDPERP